MAKRTGFLLVFAAAVLFSPGPATCPVLSLLLTFHFAPIVYAVLGQVWGLFLRLRAHEPLVSDDSHRILWTPSASRIAPLALTRSGVSDLLGSSLELRSSSSSSSSIVEPKSADAHSSPPASSDVAVAAVIEEGKPRANAPSAELAQADASDTPPQPGTSSLA